MKNILYILILFVFVSCQTQKEAEEISLFKVVQSIVVDSVPSAFPVNFCLLTNQDKQYVAYYNSQKQMTIASRSLESENWHYQHLPSKTGWDSHNYITMAIDNNGQLHVSGNMHVDPLIYFRTKNPGDISSLQKLNMTGEQENRVTYPLFIKDQNGDLLFNYRDGGSGNGRRIWNSYDSDSESWKRLLDKPLLDGEGERNAYPHGPVRSADGWFHLVWVWRDTPDCATNHHLSYARSRDMVHWESAFGEPADLPILLENRDLWVDPIPSGGGIINGCEKFYFDSKNRPVITYHKSDENGNMQVYAARAEGDSWVVRVLTNWDTPIAFSGRGSMGFIGIKISELSEYKPGILTMTYTHRDYGDGYLVIDEETLLPLGQKIKLVPEYPEELNLIQSNFEGMEIRRFEDIGYSSEESVKYILQWETLQRNFDRPREGPLPEPSLLRLIKLREN